MVQIVNHAHCQVCGRAIEFGEKTCSTECAGKIEALAKKRRNMMLFVYAMMGLSVVLILLNYAGIVRG
jgi:predicted nucleic acid-binding Zn ribbon protein